MPAQLREATRVARKVHHCGMCGAMIKIGERHHIQTNAFDGRVYDFRTCQGCEDDGITAEVHAWCGSPWEGVVIDDAWEWAHEHRGQSADHGEEAQRWLKRNGCDCGRCEGNPGSHEGQGER